MKKLTLSLAAIGTLSLLAALPSKAQIIITEADASGSAANNGGFNNGYNQDWFELTNYGSSAVSISGWTMDDSHNSVSASVALSLLSGSTSIAAGKSVVFIEDTGTTAAAVDTAFTTSWFGSTVPAGLTLGNYGGGNVGLSQSGDSVNIYNSTGVLQAGVTFGTSTAGVSFDNSVAKLTGTTGVGASDPTLTTLSVNGVNGAFLSPTGHETGSPGAVPEPSSWALALLCAGGFVMLVRQQKTKRA